MRRSIRRSPSPDRRAKALYLETVNRTLWAWADRHHRGQLDGGQRQGRPPVLKPDLAPRNVLVPRGSTWAGKIRAAIHPRQRHRHFASLRSSQALEQSVFGAIEAFDRLEVLAGIMAECGRPAFYENQKDWKLAFEHEVATLGEWRPR